MFGLCPRPTLFPNGSTWQCKILKIVGWKTVFKTLFILLLKLLIYCFCIACALFAVTSSLKAECRYKVLDNTVISDEYLVLYAVLVTCKALNQFYFLIDPFVIVLAKLMSLQALPCLGVIMGLENIFELILACLNCI